jgi:NitT/TauT family transport system substrate-binding protein
MMRQGRRPLIMAVGTLTLMLGAVACGGGAGPAAPTSAPPAAKPASQPTSAPAAQPTTPPAAAKAASPAPAAKTGPALSSPTKINFATTSGNIMYAPYFIALSKGYFKDENLELELVITGSGAKSLTTVATGSAPLGFFDVSNGVKPIQLGQPLVAIGNLYAEPYLQVVVKQEVIDKTGVKPTDPIQARGAALKGLKIGVTTPGSGSDRNARQFLQIGGLNPERDAEIVAAGSSANQIAGFARGSLDAIVISSPGGDEAIINHGGVRLISLPAGDLPELKGTTGFAIWGHRPSLQENPALGVAVMKGIIRGIDLIQSDAEAAKAAYIEGINQVSDKPPEKEIVDVGWEGYKDGFPKDGTISNESLGKVIKFAEDVEGEDFTTTPEQMYDGQYVEEAKRQLGKS